MSCHLILDRNSADPNLSLIEYSQKYPPVSWEDVFKNAEPEIELISSILSQLGPYFPHQKDIYQAFDKCNSQNIKIVILGQDPYHTTHNGLPQANGMSFSTNRGCPVQPSLRNIYKELAREYQDFKEPEHGDLSSWANQGVLLLNTCLTVMPHQAGSHKEIWNGFITKILNSVTYNNPECIFLLWGKKAIDFSMNLGPRTIKLTASHPSPFSANRGSKDAPAFIGCDHFKTANQYLANQGKTPINWNIPI